MTTNRFIFPIFITVLLGFNLTALGSVRLRQQNANEPATKSEEILTNETIIALTKAGLSPAIIVSKIRSSKTNFNVSTNELLRLKSENVADAVVEAMIQASQAEAAKAMAAANDPAKADPNDPVAPHQPGIYLLEEKTGQREMIQIDPSIYTQSKSGGFFSSAMTYGIAKVKSKAVLRDAHARLQTENTRPVFYFYFEEKNPGLSNSGNTWGSSSTSPNEFVLVKTEAKKNSRELVVGQFNAFGAQSGTLDKYVVPFDYEKVAPGVFKVTPRQPLTDGEYCFFYGGSTPLATYGFFGAGGGSKVFDFGVKIQRPA
jgi:hypothetical protein